MINRITVIGSGATAHAACGVLTQRGLQVTIYDDERYSDALNAIREIGFITLRGHGHGIAIPHKITTDVQEAICDAVLAEYEVSPEEAAADVAEFLGKLRQLNIL